MRNQENMTTIKEKQIFSNWARLKICDMSSDKFKIAVLRMFSELWENTERQFNKIRKIIYEKMKSLIELEVIK